MAAKMNQNKKKRIFAAGLDKLGFIEANGHKWHQTSVGLGLPNQSSSTVCAPEQSKRLAVSLKTDDLTEALQRAQGDSRNRLVRCCSRRSWISLTTSRGDSRVKSRRRQRS